VPRYNIAPTQLAPVIPNRGERRLERFRWGLVPHWARDLGIGNRLINARAETAAQKPSFRTAYRRHRCLVPADGYFEWLRDGRAKVPYWLRAADGGPLVFAGLWARWQPPEGDPVLSFTVLTTEAVGVARDIHDRMPVLLAPEVRDRWLDPEPLPSEIVDELVRVEPPALRATEVSRAVNSPKNDSPACVEPPVKQPSLF
jgi:putative SOS response-associated peptidase YedK